MRLCFTVTMRSNRTTPVICIILAILNKVSGREFRIGPCNVQYLEPCTTDTIKFYLFTSDSPEAAPILLDNIDPKVPDHINLSNRNKLIVHGYAGGVDYNVTKIIRNAYLKQPNTNIFVVDWSKLSNAPCYPTAAFNTKQAGECTATFLIGLKANHPKFSCRDLHAIGFSLGAHVLSFTSNALEQAIGIKFKRITGLDPALPFFATAPTQWKLDLSDADFVDVIHTNAGVYGKIETCGHVDFYVNGGHKQPMCKGDDNEPLCSHTMAPIYFAESISSKTGFWATRCTNYFTYFFGLCRYKVEHLQVQHQPPTSQEGSISENSLDDNYRILMGESCSTTAEGVYFISTGMKSPFAMGY
ncbi:pancreatic lipase-related protein 2-like [Wyeomyia smithii]|uniref:pancreatic lipase-related protein 2-like n=1 Tax=Wyeomyia smithii TaxID=174621 RepID=UPI002467D2C3|nr:pancreatic lipase-related protein 2-like [Wyeomyia smithii]